MCVVPFVDVDAQSAFYRKFFNSSFLKGKARIQKTRNSRQLGHYRDGNSIWYENGKRYFESDDIEVEVLT